MVVVVVVVVVLLLWLLGNKWMQRIIIGQFVNTVTSIGLYVIQGKEIFCNIYIYIYLISPDTR